MWSRFNEKGGVSFVLLESHWNALCIPKNERPHAAEFVRDSFLTMYGIKLRDGWYYQLNDSGRLWARPSPDKAYEQSDKIRYVPHFDVGTGHARMTHGLQNRGFLLKEPGEGFFIVPEHGGKVDFFDLT